MPRQNPDNLEQLIDRTLRELPLRRAPRTLETRVLAAIAARQALPWWKRSGATAEAGSILGGPLALLAQIKAIFGGIGDVGALVLRQIPSTWIYGTIAFLAVMYATLIGVGATACRLFLQQR